MAPQILLILGQTDDNLEYIYTYHREGLKATGSYILHAHCHGVYSSYDADIVLVLCMVPCMLDWSRNSNSVLAA
jgi:hypothetical protein